MRRLALSNSASRRHFLTASAGIMALTALEACSSAAPAVSPTEAAKPTAATQSVAPTATPKPTPATAAKPAAQSSTTQGTKGEIVVYYGADHNHFFRKLISQFTQETKVAVKYEVEPAYDAWVQLMSTRLASGYTEPDAFHGDDLQTIQYGAAGWLEPLDSLVRQYKIDLKDWPPVLITQVSSWKGKLYRLPWGNDTEIWFYRTDFFQEAGVKPPKDWNDFVTVAEKLTSGTKRYGVALAGKIGGAFGNDIQHWTHQAGGSINHLDAPGSREAMTFYKHLMTKSKVAPPSTPQNDYGAILQGFLHNNYAMWWCWDGFLGAMRHSKGFWKGQVSAFLPFMGPKNDQTMTACWGWSINKFSKKKDWAGEWLNFTARPEAMKQQIIFGRVPSRISLWSDKQVQELAPSTPFVQQIYKAGDRLAARPIVPNSQAIYNAAETAMSGYLTNQIDIDTAIKNAMAKITPLLPKAQ